MMKEKNFVTSEETSLKKYDNVSNASAGKKTMEVSV